MYSWLTLYLLIFVRVFSPAVLINNYSSFQLLTLCLINWIPTQILKPMHIAVSQFQLLDYLSGLSSLCYQPNCIAFHHSNLQCTDFVNSTLKELIVWYFLLIRCKNFVHLSDPNARHQVKKELRRLNLEKYEPSELRIL